MTRQPGPHERRSTPPARRRPRPPRDVVAYVGATYLATWVLVGPLAAAGLGLTDAAPPAWSHALGALGPAAAAVGVLSWTGGRRGVRDLGGRAVAVHGMRGVWWPLALSPLLLGGVVLAVAAPVAGVTWSGWPAVLAGLGASLAYGVFEEVGWRGFLLPRLQAHRPAVDAAGWVFVVWAVWHLPMFAYRLTTGLLAVGWLVGLYFGSVWLAVLHNGTGGSVLACIVWHASYNVAVTTGGQLSAIVPASVTGLVIVGTIVAVRRVGVAELAHRPRFALDDRGRRVVATPSGAPAPARGAA